MAAKKQVVFEDRPYIPCAFVGCPTSATLRVMTKTGWANLCQSHDSALSLKAAQERCKELGLDTVEKQRAWVLAHLNIKPLRDAIRRQEAPKVEHEAEPIPF